MKRRFQFRLERVLRAREIEESVARSAWAEQERAAAQAEADCDAARDEVARACEELGRRVSPSASGKALDARHVLRDHGLLERLREEWSARREELVTRRDQAARSKTAWSERRANQLALQKLSTREAEQHRAELERSEDVERNERAIDNEVRADAARRKLRSSASPSDDDGGSALGSLP